MTDEVSQGREPERPPVGGRHRRTLVMAGVVLVFLAVVVVVGLIRGQPDPKHRATDTSSSSPSAIATGTTPSSRKPLQLTGVRCAKLDGDALTVGFGVANTSGSPYVLSEATPTFPTGGLTADASATPDTSSCPATASGLPTLLGEGQQTLVTLVLTPTDPRCVGPLAVDVRVAYGSGDSDAYVDTLHPFPDLGGFGLPSECDSGG